MYGVITQGDFTNPLFPYIYLGNAFYSYVFTVMNGVSWAVIDDREHYKTLKYMYVAPIRIPIYLLGRGVAGFLTASLSVVITILAGVLFLHVSFDPMQANWPLFTRLVADRGHHAGHDGAGSGVPSACWSFVTPVSWPRGSAASCSSSAAPSTRWKCCPSGCGRSGLPSPSPTGWN